VHILDVYNQDIYPQDRYARRGITDERRVRSGVRTTGYLRTVRSGMKNVIKFRPDLIIYNAGTDCLEGDPLGDMNISPEGIVERDQIVMKTARENNVPVVMLLSGGYQACNARVIADSIINLKKTIH
jgi:histone deacetylase 11